METCSANEGKDLTTKGQVKAPRDYGLINRASEVVAW